MTSETLSTELKYATTSQNVAGVPTTVATWNVPDGARIRIEQGHAVVMDAETTTGAKPSRSARFGLAYREPNDPLDAWTPISDLPVAPFNTLSLKDQQSGDNAQRRRMTFDPENVEGGVIEADDADELALLWAGPEKLDAAQLFFNYPMSFIQS